jgi:crossover junction endodeoxyribonuclease RuvC
MSLRILGVDPGTLVTGYGVIDVVGSKGRLVDAGVIRTATTMPMPLRLRKIHLGLMEVIEQYAPDEFAIESAFYAKNVQSTLKLGHARGVSILAAALCEVPTSEYAPREIKQSVVGTGNATKEQVAYMVRSMLGGGHTKGERTAPGRMDDLSLDASDALGVALCHMIRISGGTGTKSQGKQSWGEFVRKNPDRVKGRKK